MSQCAGRPPDDPTTDWETGSEVAQGVCGAVTE